MATKVISDEEILDALKQANGKPTLAARKLGVTYHAVYLRIKSSKELQEVQKSCRPRVFHDMMVIAEEAVRTGYMKKIVLDGAGNPTNVAELVPVDEKTRLEGAFRLMQMFKVDEELVDKMEVNLKSSVDISSWLNLNTLRIDQADDRDTKDI